MVATSLQAPHVALLRGINVGGKNKLPMKALAGLFAEAGCSDVQTYIQSGNVVFSADEATVHGLGERISGDIAEQFGLRVPVLIQDGEEMRKAVRNNPFVKARVEESLLHVYFLEDEPPAAAITKLDLERSPGDSFVVAGRSIYLHLPNGVARTKLTNVYFDKQLGTVSTLRNWRTAVTLTGMLGLAED